MALSYIDQFSIATNKQAFEGIVIIGATRFANDWLAGGNAYMTGEKIFDTEANLPAAGYLSKMHGLCVRVCNQDRNLFNSIQTMLGVIIADTMPKATLEALGAGINDFVKYNEGAFNAMVLKAFERISGCYKSEKQAYDAI